MTEFLVWLATALMGTDGQEPSAEKVIRMALNQRQEIRTFAGTFSFEGEEANEKGKKKLTTLRFWLDGNKLRQDYMAADTVKEIKCRNCEKEGQFIHFANTETMPGKRVYMEYGTMPGDGRRGDANYNNLFLIDPRAFGLLPLRAGHMHQYPLDAILGTADRTSPTLERTKWDGKDAFIVRFDAKSGPKAKFAFWIVPSMDHSVVQCELNSEDGAGEKYAATLKCAMEKYGKKGVWFPKSYTAEGSTGGKNVWRESTQITDVKINEDLPADTFKLAGMNIPVGWPIYGSAVPVKGNKYQWDGSKMIERDRPKAKGQPNAVIGAPAEGSTKTILLAGAGGLAVSGAVALGFFFRKRKES